jgi:SAM-dependent methyltransferase
MRSDIQRFWDRRAEENAFFFIDNRLDYRRPERERFWSEGERDLDALLASLGVSVEPTDEVLEIGCGVGRLTRVLAARGASVRALDVSGRMLELGRELNPALANVTWILGDGVTLEPIESRSVDVCISHVVFQHIPDPAITLGYVREIGRVLRPGGWAGFQLSNRPSTHRPPSLLKRARHWIVALTRRGPRAQDDPRWLGSAVQLNAVRRAAEDASMTVERIVGAGTQMCCVLTRRLERVSG